MAKASKIEWCDGTFNPWIGCTRVSTEEHGGGGCDGCYAAISTPARVLRAGGAETWGPGAPRRRTSAANWRQPITWNAHSFVECSACHWRGEERAADWQQVGAERWCLCPSCKGEGTLRAARRRVFCASLADVFDNEVDPAWRADLFALIHATPNLDWLLLTKRIGNAFRMMHEARRGFAKPPLDFELMFDGKSSQTALPNVWLGATVVNQAEADRDIPKLLATPAAVRFLSTEPMLGPINLHPWLCAYGDPARLEQRMSPICEPAGLLDWIIVGGESGPHARPAHPDWFRSLRDQCAAADVPFLFKQWGEHDLSFDRDRDDPDCRHCNRETRKPGRWINLAGGHGFNGERVHYAHKVGKARAGRLLDGVEHNGFPEVRHG